MPGQQGLQHSGREWESEPFRDSLCSVALIGMRAAGAEGYAFFEKLEGAGAVRRLTACGTPIPESALIAGYQGLGVIAYPLRSRSHGAIDGVLAFAFSEPPQLPKTRQCLDQIAETIATLWATSDPAGQYLSLIERISALETRLVDSKIADRARGFLLSSDLGSVETIARHVERLLRRTETRSVIENLLHELEEEVEERRVARLAKSILQSTTSMTEEEAHAYLRTLSRRSRKRLKDAAAAVIENHNASQVF